MARIKLEELRQEILKYIGIPYHTNRPKKNFADNSLIGKGSAKEIALKTIEIANKENIKLIDLTAKQIYNLQKKNGIGIDCSGLVCHLLNFYFQSKLNPRRTSADMLTSTPLSTEIESSEVTTADLVRQKNGHHVLFVIEKIGDKIIYVDSSIKGRGVHFGEFDLNDKKFKTQGFFRLFLLN